MRLVVGGQNFLPVAATLLFDHRGDAVAQDVDVGERLAAGTELVTEKEVEGHVRECLSLSVVEPVVADRAGEAGQFGRFLSNDALEFVVVEVGKGRAVHDRKLSRSSNLREAAAGRARIADERDLISDACRRTRSFAEGLGRHCG